MQGRGRARAGSMVGIVPPVDQYAFSWHICNCMTWYKNAPRIAARGLRLLSLLLFERLDGAVVLLLRVFRIALVLRFPLRVALKDHDAITDSRSLCLVICSSFAMSCPFSRSITSSSFLRRSIQGEWFYDATPECTGVQPTDRAEESRHHEADVGFSREGVLGGKRRPRRMGRRRARTLTSILEPMFEARRDRIVTGCGSCQGVGMTPVFQNSSTRSLFLVDILMSVVLGLVVADTFDRWLRGMSFVGWFVVLLLMGFAVATVSMTVWKRIT
jgi:hypothetical protein